MRAVHLPCGQEWARYTHGGNCTPLLWRDTGHKQHHGDFVKEHRGFALASSYSRQLQVCGAHAGLDGRGHSMGVEAGCHQMAEKAKMS
jgi:hypothetical protein